VAERRKFAWEVTWNPDRMAQLMWLEAKERERRAIAALLKVCREGQEPKNEAAE
jgi:hypothetical protein